MAIEVVDNVVDDIRLGLEVRTMKTSQKTKKNTSLLTFSSDKYS